MKPTGTETELHVLVRPGLTDRERELVQRQIEAIAVLFDEHGRPPTWAEVEARVEQRKTPRPTELTYVPDDEGGA